MNVNLHIEQLILDGFDLSRRERDMVETAVVTELTHLLTSEGLPSSWHSEASLSGQAIQLTVNTPPNQLGQQIAHTVYKSLGN